MSNFKSVALAATSIHAGLEFGAGDDLKAEEMNSIIGGILHATELVGKLLDKTYPVGSIYLSVNSANPGTLFGGTWVAWGQGRVPVGYQAQDVLFNRPEHTGGSKNAVVVVHNHAVYSSGAHTHTASQAPHSHNVWGTNGNDPDKKGIVGAIQNGGADYPAGTTLQTPAITINKENSSHTHTILNMGESGTNMNLQPYIVCYMWKRTA